MFLFVTQMILTLSIGQDPGMPKRSPAVSVCNGCEERGQRRLGPLRKACERLVGGGDRLFGGDDYVANLGQLSVLAGSRLMEAAEGVLLVNPGTLHENALGPLDHLAVLKRLAQVGGFPTECMKLREPPYGHGEGRCQVDWSDQFDQMSQGVIVGGTLGVDGDHGVADALQGRREPSPTTWQQTTTGRPAYSLKLIVCASQR